MNTQSTYMQWAKKRPKVKYDLALSGILNLPFPELEAQIEDIDLNGDNSYGYAPLVDALAEHCDVPAEQVVTISGGTSMANHLAMAAAIEHGDELPYRLRRHRKSIDPHRIRQPIEKTRLSRFGSAFQVPFRSPKSHVSFPHGASQLMLAKPPKCSAGIAIFIILNKLYGFAG